MVGCRAECCRIRGGHWRRPAHHHATPFMRPPESLSLRRSAGHRRQAVGKHHGATGRQPVTPWWSRGVVLRRQASRADRRRLARRPGKRGRMWRSGPCRAGRVARIPRRTAGRLRDTRSATSAGSPRWRRSAGSPHCRWRCTDQHSRDRGECTSASHFAPRSDRRPRRRCMSGHRRSRRRYRRSAGRRRRRVSRGTGTACHPRRSWEVSFPWTRRLLFAVRSSQFKPARCQQTGSVRWQAGASGGWCGSG